MKIAAGVALASLLLVAKGGFAGTPDESGAWLAGVNQYRAAREERLASDSGWLTLVGLEWVQEGESRIGSGAESDIVLAGGPEFWGVVSLEDGKLAFQRADDPEVTVNGGTPQLVAMVADTEGEPTLVRSGTLSFHPIFRESYGLRVKDTQAPTRLGFDGLDYFETDRDWLVNGLFEMSEEGATVDVVNVLGQVGPSPVFGTLVFEKDGREHRLLALGDEESSSLWFIFSDRTNSKETYGAGRFLYSDGMPENGRLLVDFNKAYNPPCAFNDYSTCPLPPPENRLDLAVTAGEKDFKH